tara:strand:- start:1289 stop:1918 length:630 start_codon:yes stop_codon:yes gene_type:complete
MASTHKQANQTPLAILALVYGAGFFLSLRGLSALESLSSISAQLISSAAFTVVGLLVVSVITGQLDAVQKARFIFLRWSDPLPGGEAFSTIMNSDTRIGVDELVSKHGPFPTTRAEQNRYWYKMYKAVASDQGVQDASKQYLLFRDATILAAFLGAGFSIALLLLGDGIGTKALFASFCVGALLLIWRAARVAGRRLVVQVLMLNPAVE